LKADLTDTAKFNHLMLSWKTFPCCREKTLLATKLERN